VAHADDQHENILVAHGIHNDVILTGVDAAEFARTFQFLGSFPARIGGQKVKPSGHAFLDVPRQRIQFSLSTRSEGEAVSHGSESQSFLDLIPGDRLLAGALEFLKGATAFLRPITVFQRFQEFQILFAHQKDGLGPSALDANPLTLIGDAVERVRRNPGFRRL